MRTSFRLSLLAIVAASLVACGDREIMPTGITPRAASKDFTLTIDPNLFVEITAGNDFTCARQNSGNVYCWGRADYAQVGQTARGCMNQISVPPCVPRPTLIKKLGGMALSAVVVDAGGYHACALERQTTQVWCWGAGGNGQLGVGGGQAPSAGPPLPVPGMTNVSLLSAGTYASCAQNPAGMFCWGELNPSRFLVPPPASAPVLWQASSNYLDLSVGNSHACAIAAPDRSVVCWGSNDNGQAASTLKASLIQQMPVATLFGSPAASLVTQDYTTCVEMMNGTTQCAGRNWYGMFGNTTALGSSTATPSTLIAGGPLYDITTGEHHACGLDANGAAFCWGYNGRGQLGNTENNGNTVPNPRPVAGGRTYRAIAAGANHTCAIGTDNVIYCWGDNTSGQLGAWVLSCTSAGADGRTGAVIGREREQASARLARRLRLEAGP